MVCEYFSESLGVFFRISGSIFPNLLEIFPNLLEYFSNQLGSIFLNISTKIKWELDRCIILHTLIIYNQLKLKEHQPRELDICIILHTLIIYNQFKLKEHFQKNTAENTHEDLSSIYLDQQPRREETRRKKTRKWIPEKCGSRKD